MKLFYSPTSPFVRKCLVVADELNCYDNITLIDCNAHPIQRDQTIIQRNPLGQVPTLITEEDKTLFDSQVICSYLNHIQKGNLFGTENNQWEILKEQALADGIMTTAVLLRIETSMRPSELEWKDLTQGHIDKINSALSYFNSYTEHLYNSLNIAHITLACALTYINFRLPHLDWTKKYPNLAIWLKEFQQRPSMQKTEYANKV